MLGRGGGGLFFCSIVVYKAMNLHAGRPLRFLSRHEVPSKGDVAACGCLRQDMEVVSVDLELRRATVTIADRVQTITSILVATLNPKS